MINFEDGQEGPARPLVIQTDRLKCTLGLAVSSSFFIGFVIFWLSKPGNMLAFVFAVAFAAFSLMWGCMLTPGCRLELSENGFALIAPFRCVKVRWEAIEKIGIMDFGLLHFVYFRVNSSVSNTINIKFLLNRIAWDYDDILPNVFSLSSDELFILLVDWHARFEEGKKRGT